MQQNDCASFCNPASVLHGVNLEPLRPTTSSMDHLRHRPRAQQHWQGGKYITPRRWVQVARQLLELGERPPPGSVVTFLKLGIQNFDLLTDIVSTLPRRHVGELAQFVDALLASGVQPWYLPTLVNFGLDVNLLNPNNKPDSIVSTLISLGFRNFDKMRLKHPLYYWLVIRRSVIAKTMVGYWRHLTYMPGSLVECRLARKYNAYPTSNSHQTMEAKIVDIARKYSSRQALRAWNMPFPAMDMLEADAKNRRTHTPTNADHVFNKIIIFFEQVDDAIVAFNDEYEDVKFLDAILMVTNQERVHKRVYDWFAVWWRGVRPLSMEDACINVKPERIMSAGVGGFIAINFLLERCALPLIFDCMHTIKNYIVDSYGSVSAEVYNINDEVIADEVDHGKQFLECWNVVKGTVNADEFAQAKTVIWKMIEPILGDSKPSVPNKSYLDLYNLLVDGKTVELTFHADTQSARPFDGSRQGYLNVDMTDRVSEIASQLDRDEPAAKRPRTDDGVDVAVTKIIDNCKFILSKQ